jgi:acyl-homoserine lactone synthase
MELIAIRGTETKSRAGLMDEAWKLRSKVFVEERCWRSLQATNGREIDEFDHDGAIHFLLVRQGRVAAYSRVLPTTGPHLLADAYPHLVYGPVPRGPGIWEWTRMCVAPWFRDRRPSGFHLMAHGVVAYALDHGVDELSLQAHPDWILSFERIGFASRPLGLGTMLEGERVVPFILHIEPENLIALEGVMARITTPQLRLTA